MRHQDQQHQDRKDPDQRRTDATTASRPTGPAGRGRRDRRRPHGRRDRPDHRRDVDQLRDALAGDRRRSRSGSRPCATPRAARARSSRCASASPPSSRRPRRRAATSVARSPISSSARRARRVSASSPRQGAGRAASTSSASSRSSRSGRAGLPPARRAGREEGARARLTLSPGRPERWRARRSLLAIIVASGSSNLSSLENRALVARFSRGDGHGADSRSLRLFDVVPTKEQITEKLTRGDRPRAAAVDRRARAWCARSRSATTGASRWSSR